MAIMLYTRVQAALASLRDREDGVTMIEYGLLAALIAVALIVVIQALTGALSGTFQNIANAL